MVSIKKVEDRAEGRISFGNRTSLALLDASKIIGSSDQMALGRFLRMRACNSRANNWVGDDLHSEETGELYAANGSFWSCGSRLCANCAAKVASRNRKKLKLALENQKLLRGERYKFITLKVPNPNLSLLKTRGILNKAWALLRKRKYFVDNIRGCAKGEEFTVTQNGFHYHFHLLCLGKFIDYEYFRGEWTDCVRTAFNQFNVPFKVNTRDGLLDIYNKEISSSNGDLKEAIQKICSYLTKSNSWEKMPEKDLIEFASIKRFPRMFALLGSFGNQSKVNKVKNSARKNKNGNADIIFNKRDIYDGENSELNGVSDRPQRIKLKKCQRERELDWGKYMKKYGADSYEEKLKKQVEYTVAYRMDYLRRKFLRASFKTLENEAF